MKKFILILLGVTIMAGSFVSCSEPEQPWADSGLRYTDGKAIFNQNPGRGHANTMDSQFWVICKDDGTTYTAKESDFTSYGVYTPLFELSAFSSGNDSVYSGIPNVKTRPELVGGTNKPLNDQTLEAIEASFRYAKANNVVCMPRIAYDKDGVAGKEPDDIKTIIGHIEQVSEIINRYVGTVCTVECGVIGPYGEMWGSKYVAKENANQILDAWLSNLDESITLLVRNPSYILNYLGTNAEGFKQLLPLGEDSPAYRLGLYNDGYMGTNTDWGTFVGPNEKEVNNLSRESAITFMKDQNLRMPYGGEFAHPRDIEYIKANGSPIFTDGFVKELYDTHLSYARNIGKSVKISEHLKTMVFSEQYAFEGMPDVSEYYGESLWRFVMNHMGYRFVVRSAETTPQGSRGGTVKLRGRVENTGFGNVLFPTVSELVLEAPDGQIITAEVDIKAEEWQTGQMSDYEITMSIPADAKEGDYRAYLRIGTTSYQEAKAPSSGTIRFANQDIYSTQTGGNYMGTITVTGKKSGHAEHFEQVR